MDDHSYFKSLSLISKQFLNITNRLRSSLAIYIPTIPFLPCLLQRFPNLTSIDIKCYYYKDLDNLLIQVSRFPLKLTSLNLSNQLRIPANGLRAFSKNITTVTSLICSNLEDINSTDLPLIADCFPMLEELDLSNPNGFMNCYKFSKDYETLSLALFKLRK
ncbi:F-box/LRR-repeat protein, partial [Trifolium pratense]